MATPTSSTDARTLVDRRREYFNSGATRPHAWRKSQLLALRRMIVENETALERALADDLGKPATEAHLSEIGFVLAEISYALKQLSSWCAPRRVRVPGSLAPASARVLSEPLGVVLIIGPWNYPVQLVLAPLVGALAAGNAAVIKPSELAPATSSVLARLVDAYLDSGAITVAEGGIPETGWLLEQRWDYIMYTGNERVARVVAQAAATHLTPVTLELGGKSPTFVDETTDVSAAAKRIVWGKFVNAGQTCVAPDYVLVTSAVRDKLERALTSAIESMFSDNPRESPSYGRIVNQHHFDRLARVMGVLPPGADRGSLYFPPTLLFGATESSPAMEDEIFGPILPLIEVSDFNEAIDIITSRPKPLALYVFSESPKVRRAFTRRTSSGALGFNIPLAHMGVHGLPFGGVGASGSGAYHGKLSFDTFSHDKAILSKPLRPETLHVIFPPYSSRKSALVKGALRKLS